MSTTLTGKVKWFNSTAGYGFIQLLKDGSDMFVHFKQLETKVGTDRYLVPGEYVEFVTMKVDRGEHTCMADRVTGIGGGPLMCETRFSLRRKPKDPKEGIVTIDVSS
jgi:cold shock CspA family protein